MTLAEILSNEELRHHEFPVTRNHIFLGHAGVSALPRRVSEAVREYALQSTLGDQELLAPSFQIQKTRALAAQLIHAQPEEVAFVGPTSLGLSLVANSLRFRRSDNILIYFDDFPSNVYPWMALADRGIEVRLLNTRELGRIRPIDVMGQVDEQTKLVSFASCHFLSGYRLELDAIGKYLHERNILFCVDGIQTLGAFPTTVENLDFLVADAHKWLLGPCAAGLLYVKKDLHKVMRPPVYGWHNVDCPEFVAQERIELRGDARRFEAGTENLLGLVGLHAALELILEIGVESIAAEILRKRSWFVPALKAKGYTVLHGDVQPANASGIITFHKPGEETTAIHARLEAANISTIIRSDRSGKKYIRVSPHFYNTDAELHRVLEAL
jgi:selenocysteine lyase/cysteine desulfurase